MVRKKEEELRGKSRFGKEAGRLISGDLTFGRKGKGKAPEEKRSLPTRG